MLIGAEPKVVVLVKSTFKGMHPLKGDALNEATGLQKIFMICVAVSILVPSVTINVTTKFPQVKYSVDGLGNVEFTPAFTPKFHSYCKPAPVDKSLNNTDVGAQFGF